MVNLLVEDTVSVFPYQLLKLCCGLPIYPLETDSLEITKRKAQQAIHYGEEVFYKMSDCFIKHGIINYITVLPPNKIQ